MLYFFKRTRKNEKKKERISMSIKFEGKKNHIFGILY